VFPKDQCVWLDGGGIATEDDFWDFVVRQLMEPVSIALQGAEGVTDTHGGSGEGGFSAVGIVSGKAQYSQSHSDTRTSSETHTVNIGKRASALRGLEQRKIPVVIDDFHYMGKELQGPIIRSLKAPIFDGLPVILIAIPHRRFDAVKVEREMTGRVEQIPIPVWNERDLEAIAKTGFFALKIVVQDAAIARMAAEALGSPHLMQEFCRESCREVGVLEELPVAEFKNVEDHLDSIFRRVADNTGRSMFEKLAKGPRQRKDRKMRKMKGGGESDIYKIVLAALASLKPGLTTGNRSQGGTGVKASGQGER
jgi:hypothetical protein